MFAAVAGLRTHQAKMDVIGNNIANVNTWGYKAGSVSFKDTMYQSTSSGGAGSTEEGGYGGTNANQVGYGVTTGAIAYDFTTGGMSPSASALDCMIDGTGFFIVGPMKDGGVSPDEMGDSGLYLSRVGNFTVDGNGYLVDSSGNYVYGFSNSESGDYTNSDEINTELLTPLRIPLNTDLASTNAGKSTDLVAAAQKALSEAQANLNSLTTAEGIAKGAALAAQAAYTKAADKVKDPSDAVTSIDALTAALDTAKTEMNDAYKAWEENPDDSSKEAEYYNKKLAYDEKNYNLMYANAELNASSAAPAAGGDSNLVTRQNALKTAWTDYKKAFEAEYLGGAAATPGYADANKALSTAITAALTVDDESYAGKKASSSLEAAKATAMVTAAANTVTKKEASLKAAMSSAGKQSEDISKSDDQVATLTNYKIQTDGSVTGVTESGITIIIGKIALAGVQNTGGLEKTSGYYYNVGSNAGNVSIYEAGGTEGTILGNYLEMATVDLATEMTNMITTQRGFQANSKIITVTDQMLEELVNMKR